MVELGFRVGGGVVETDGRVDGRKAGPGKKADMGMKERLGM